MSSSFFFKSYYKTIITRLLAHEIAFKKIQKYWFALLTWQNNAMHARRLQQASLSADSRRESVTVHVWVSFHGNAGDTNIEINGNIHRLGSF